MWINKHKILMRKSMLLAGLFLTIGRMAASEPLNLDRAMAEALANNPRMAEAEAYRRAAEYAEKAAWADFFPKMSAAYGFRNLAEEPYANIMGRKTIVNSTTQHHWEVGLTQPLFTGFSVSSQHQLARLGLATRELEARQTELTLARLVKRNYLGLLMAQKALTVAETAEKNLAAHADDAARFYEQGLIPRNDLLKAQVAAAEAVQQKVKAAARVRNTSAALNVLLGRDYQAEIQLADVSPPDPFKADSTALVAEALSGRTDVDILTRAIAAKEQEIRLAQSDYYPKVELLGKYEQDGDDLGARHNDYANQYNASIGVQARWVFFEAGKTRARAAKALAEQEAVEKALQRLKDDVRLQVQEACLDLDTAEKNITTTQQALEQAREHFRITNTRYQQQLTTSTEVLDARTYLTRAETGYYEALYGCWTARADLDFAMGRK